MITGSPSALLKKTISPIGKCGPSQRTAANMIANISIAITLQSMPRNGLSWAACKAFASEPIRWPGSEPAAALEIEIRQQPGDEDHPKRYGIGPGLIQLGHEAEVHPPDRREHGRRQEHDGGHRHDLDDVVLLVVDQA